MKVQIVFSQLVHVFSSVFPQQSHNLSTVHTRHALYLFVYGSLRRTHAQHPLLRGARYLGRAWTQGRLVDLGAYPGLLPSVSGELVCGEVYRLTSPAQLRRLDEHEECGPQWPCPREYRRRLRPVRMNNGLRMSVWIYLYARPGRARPAIPSGDYRRARQKNRIIPHMHLRRSCSECSAGNKT